MHKLSSEVTDKPSRGVACRVIASVTQYQHRKLRNATHVSAQKQPSAADGCELCLSLTQWSSQWFVRLSWLMHLVSTMSGHIRATDNERGFTNVTYRHTASCSDSMWLMMSLRDNQSSKTDTSTAVHLTYSHSGQKQKRGSGTACNDSCIKRISKLTQLANASLVKQFVTIIYNKQNHWQFSSLALFIVHWHLLKCYIGIQNKHSSAIKKTLELPCR